MIPCLAYPFSIRVDVDINIHNGDGTLNGGDKNNTEEERNNSGSNREDSSDRSKNVNTDKT